MAVPDSFARVRRVSTQPKATVLQRTPKRPYNMPCEYKGFFHPHMQHTHSLATVLVKPTTPALAVA